MATLLQILVTAIVSVLGALAGFITYQTRKARAADERETSRVSSLREELVTLRAEFDAYRVAAEAKRNELQFKVDGLIASNETKDSRIEQLEKAVNTAQARQTAQSEEKATLIEIIREVLKMLPEAWSQQVPRVMS